MSRSGDVHQGRADEGTAPDGERRAGRWERKRFGPYNAVFQLWIPRNDLVADTPSCISHLPSAIGGEGDTAVGSQEAGRAGQVRHRAESRSTAGCALSGYFTDAAPIAVPDSRPETEPHLCAVVGQRLQVLLPKPERLEEAVLLIAGCEGHGRLRVLSEGNGRAGEGGFGKNADSSNCICQTEWRKGVLVDVRYTTVNLTPVIT